MHLFGQTDQGHRVNGLVGAKLLSVAGQSDAGKVIARHRKTGALDVEPFLRCETDGIRGHVHALIFEDAVDVAEFFLGQWSEEHTGRRGRAAAVDHDSPAFHARSGVGTDIAVDDD